MKRQQETRTRFYRDCTDDFVESRNQSFRLPDDFVWVHGSIVYHFASLCLYIAALLFSLVYTRFGLHVKYENTAVLKQRDKSGFFLFANHTQPIGDAFMPVRALAPKRCYILVSPANLGIPVLGPLLPMLGALLIPDSLSGMKNLDAAIRHRILERRCVVVYPEAHVWPWYTGIRPFLPASFGYPVDCNAASYCMTTTYQERRPGKKPALTVYLDGPFFPDSTLSRRAQKLKLRDEIFACMTRRSQSSTCQYIRYEKGEQPHESFVLRR